MQVFNKLMSIVDSIRASNGVTTFMNRFETGFTSKQSHRKQDQFINNILVHFAKAKQIEGIHRNNSPGYKGSFNPLIANSPIIQEHWQEFKKWMHNNYKLRNDVEKD